MKNKHLSELNNSLHFKYQRSNYKTRNIDIKSKHRSMARLRSPHADKRGLDQFDYVIYRQIKNEKYIKIRN